MRRLSPRVFATLAFATLVFATLGGCTPGLAVPTAADAARAAESQYPGTSLEQLMAGREAYVAKCSGCHRLFDPSDRDAAGWHDMVGDMRDRSHLSSEQEEAILRYLVVMSATSFQKPTNRT